MKKGLYALAAGTFGLGIVEYSIMGILPNIAADLGVSITQGGHIISSYALGVCVGAPIVALFARNWPLRKVLLILVALFTAGSLLTVFSPNYALTLCARFLTGLPHGAFFGVGVIVANRLVDKGKATSAVATMVMGMTISNLIGVPLSNLVGQYLSWRVVFAFASVWGILTIVLILRWIPVLAPLPRSNVKGMVRFLRKPQPWLLLFATTLSSAGIFSWYSYVNPFLTGVSGFKESLMPLFMLMAGASMCVGNYLGGRLSDRYTPELVSTYTLGMMFVSLTLIFLFGSFGAASLVLLCVITGCLFAISSPQQQLLLQHSPGGEMMGGAMVQLAFNLGNAIGAYLGGVPIATGVGVQYSPLIGAGLAFVGVSVLLVFNRIQRRGVTLAVVGC